jgi:hypothetical protein
MKLTTKAFDMAGQENCDGPEYDMIQECATRIVLLEKLVRELRDVPDTQKIAEWIELSDRATEILKR